LLRDPCATAKAKATRGRQAQDDNVVKDFIVKKKTIRMKKETIV